MQINLKICLKIIYVEFSRKYTLREKQNIPCRLPFHADCPKSPEDRQWRAVFGRGMVAHVVLPAFRTWRWEDPEFRSSAVGRWRRTWATWTLLRTEWTREAHIQCQDKYDVRFLHQCPLEAVFLSGGAMKSTQKPLLQRKREIKRGSVARHGSCVAECRLKQSYLG